VPASLHPTLALSSGPGRLSAEGIVLRRRFRALVPRWARRVSVDYTPRTESMRIDARADRLASSGWLHPRGVRPKLRCPGLEVTVIVRGIGCGQTRDARSPRLHRSAPRQWDVRSKPSDRLAPGATIAGVVGVEPPAEWRGRTRCGGTGRQPHGDSSITKWPDWRAPRWRLVVMSTADHRAGDGPGRTSARPTSATMWNTKRGCGRTTGTPG